MQIAGYVLGYKDTKGNISITSPLRVMTRDQADICKQAKAIEYPITGDECLILGVVEPEPASAASGEAKE
jgi:hypothetical protein